jgi:hypothetical protein
LQAAADRASAVLNFDPGLSIISPDTWDTAALELAIKGRLSHGSTGRFVAFYDPKADEDARVHPGQNVFLRYPPVHKERLEAFLTAVDSIMQPKQDFVVIFEGRVKENRGIILKLLEKDMKWQHREMTLVSDKGAFDKVLVSGTTKKRRRIHRGFATAKYRENVFICWKGKVPRVQNRRRTVVDVGAWVADDTMSNVPVLPLKDRPTVPAATKAEVFKGSTWAGKADDGQESDSSLDDHSDCSSKHANEQDNAETPKSSTKSANKRGRALVRKPTDVGAVPLFTHPIHPNLIREFVISLSATWAIFGTPESGCGLMGCLSPLAKVPVVAFARNAAHANVLTELVKNTITEQCLQLNCEWTSKALAAQWANLCSDSMSSDASSGSAGSDDETDAADGTDGKGGKTPEDKKEEKKSRGKKRGKKELKDDTKKDDKNASKKAKKDKPEKKNKKAKKDDTGSKANNDKHKHNKSGSAPSSSSVLDALLKIAA